MALAKENAHLLSIEQGNVVPVRLAIVSDGVVGVGSWRVDVRYDYFHDGQYAFMSDGPMLRPPPKPKHVRRKRWRRP